MYKIKILGILAIVLILVETCSPPTENKTLQSQTTNDTEAASRGLPSFNLQDISGKTINLQEFKGKKVFVNIWASWCPPCKAEMPSIEKLYASVDKNKVAFVMLSYDEDQDASRNFIQSNKLSLPVYFPAQAAPAVFNTDGIPATFIFDENGQLIKQKIGADNYDTQAYRQLFL